jgi:hypothetical protein
MIFLSVSGYNLILQIEIRGLNNNGPRGKVVSLLGKCDLDPNSIHLKWELATL